MKRYLIVALAIIVVGAYFFGVRVADMRCVTTNARANSDEIIKVINIKRNSDEKGFNTGVRDIRHIMRTKYTIAE